VRFGHWVTIAFPMCGCDACNERVENEIEHLQARVEDVITGRCRESVSTPEAGDAWRSYEFGSLESGSAGLARDQALQLLAAGPTSYEWAPWRRRQ